MPRHRKPARTRRQRRSKPVQVDVRRRVEATFVSVAAFEEPDAHAELPPLDDGFEALQTTRHAWLSTRASDPEDPATRETDRPAPLRKVGPGPDDTTELRFAGDNVVAIFQATEPVHGWASLPVPDDPDPTVLRVPPLGPSSSETAPIDPRIAGEATVLRSPAHPDADPATDPVELTVLECGDGSDP